IPEDLIQTVITSPTYWGKRQFTDDPKEFGSESLEEYVSRNVSLYSKILSKLKKSGSLFVIIQDSYMGSGISRSHHSHWDQNKNPEYIRDGLHSIKQGNVSSVTAKHSIIKNKSLCGIPYRIAIELVDLGFIWRQHIIWEKPNPMPENVKDRLRQSSEYILHFVKSGKYTFHDKYLQVEGQSGKPRMRNQVWNAPTEPRKGHTATFPTKIVEKLLLATSDENDIIFDPFLGSGTMYHLSMKHKRKFLGCDISLSLLSHVIDDIKSMQKQINLDQFLEDNDKKNNEKIKLSHLIKLNMNLNPISKDEIENKFISFINNQKEDFNNKFMENILNHFKNDKISLQIPVDSILNAKLKANNKIYQFNGLLKFNDQKIAFEIPSVSDFDSKKGAGVYYAALRISEAVKKNLIRGGILFLPYQSKDGKYKKIIDNSNNLIFGIKISQSKANKIAEAVNLRSLSEIVKIKNWIEEILIL
ncbi:MAG: DNA-methyltransferase, partial [Candidatus Hodarchaeales archaeon]